MDPNFLGFAPDPGKCQSLFAGKNYSMVAQPPVACRFVRLDNDLLCTFIVRHNTAKGQVSGVKLKLLRFFLALFKNKIIFRSVPECQYLSLAPGFFPINDYQSERGGFWYFSG
jgi:hypothetical protein